MQSFQFYNPTKILCGDGIFDNLPNTISNTYKNIFIVTDSNILNILGGKDKLEFMFNKENLNVSIYDGIKPDPTYDDINNVADIFKTISGDVIVAIGGGSVIDAAKGISIVSKHGGYISNYIGDNLVPTQVTPIISVPTTSGTGSETTPFAVFTDENNRKEGLYSDFIFPIISILDTNLTTKLPKNITAETGLDALAHAIEGYTGKSSNPFIDFIAEQVFSIIAKHLTNAYEDPENKYSRSSMALASALGGIVITRAGVGAAHGFGMTIGGLYKQPHGRTIATLLPHVMKYNAKSKSDRFLKITKIFHDNIHDKHKNILKNINLNSHYSASAFVDYLCNYLNIPSKLNQLNVKEDDIKFILDDCLERQDFNNNILEFNKNSAQAFLESIV